MSTRSYIGISDDLFKTNEAKCIYCHFDGYLEGVGNTLASFYNSAAAAESLFGKGSLDSLGDTIEECDFYGDKDALTLNFTGETFFEHESEMIDYFYVFDRRNMKWFVVEKTKFELFPSYIPLKRLLKGYGIKPRKRR